MNQSTVDIVQDDFDLRTATTLLKEVINEIDAKRIPLSKTASQVMKLAESVSRIKQEYHDRITDKRITFRVETVELIFNGFENLIKQVCSDDIRMLEDFSLGLKQLGQRAVADRDSRLRR